MGRSSLFRFSVQRVVLGLTILLNLVVTAVGAQSQKSGAQGGKAPAGNVENGRKAFIQHGCFSCHGFSGEGGAGPRLVQNPIPFQAFAKYIRRPKLTMPPFGTHVPDQELADIYAFLKSIPASPDPKSIPLLSNP